MPEPETKGQRALEILFELVYTWDVPDWAQGNGAWENEKCEALMEEMSELVNSEEFGALSNQFQAFRARIEELRPKVR